MTRVKVDFNALVRDGLLKASGRRSSGQLRVGHRVEVFDPSEPGMVFEADVVEYNAETQRALLNVHWEPAAVTDRHGWVAYGQTPTTGSVVVQDADFSVRAQRKTWSNSPAVLV
jgi:hypothetical protein